MSAAPGLWLIAAAGSLALHGAVGAAIYVMPLPDTPAPVRTEIDIATLTAGTTARAARSEKAAVVAAARAAPIRGDGGALQPIATPTTIAARPAPSSKAAAPVAATRAEVRLPDKTVGTSAPSARAEAVEPSGQASAVAEPDKVAAPAAAAPATAAAVAASAALAPPIAQAAPLRPATPAALSSPAPAGSVASRTEAEPVAAIEARAPTVAVGGAAGLAPAQSPAAPPAASPTRETSSAIAQSAATSTIAATRPAADIPAAASARSQESAAVAPRPAPMRTDGMATVAAPRAPAARAARPVLAPAAPTETAMAAPVPQRPDVPREMLPAARRPGPPRVGDFLAGHDDDCLLALPAGIGPTQATVDAYAARPETVERLGADYQRLSGRPLTATLRPVSRDQCSALSFARSLAQYPDFPLRLTLSETTIDSGQALSGVISGLRKDTLYLIIVDDEGKAQLVSSYLGQRVTLTNFRAPMTLTSGPVSSVQLLVAIASDGPLRTLPERPGLPAEDYFERLAREIVADQRSIAFGITSFVVR
jgi:hypothetical protein